MRDCRNGRNDHDPGLSQARRRGAAGTYRGNTHTVSDEIIEPDEPVIRRWIAIDVVQHGVRVNCLRGNKGRDTKR